MISVLDTVALPTAGLAGWNHTVLAVLYWFAHSHYSKPTKSTKGIVV